MIQIDEERREELFSLLEENEWDKLQSELTHLANDHVHTRLRVDLRLLQSRLLDFRDREMQGLLREEDRQIERAKISAAFSYLIQRLFHKNVPPPPLLEEARQARRRRLITRWSLVIALIALLISSHAIYTSSIHKQRTFSNTFFIKGAHLHDCPIEEGSSLTVFLSDQPYHTSINEYCQVTVNQIPQKFQEERIPVGVKLQATGYELIQPDSQYILAGEPIHLQVSRDNSLGWVFGKVWQKAKKGIFQGAEIEIKSGRKSWVIESDSRGNFEFYVPKPFHQKEYQLVITMDQEIWKGSYFPGGEKGVEILGPE